jgi:hypothetical protein
MAVRPVTASHGDMALANRELLVIEFVVALIAWFLIARAFWWPRILRLPPHMQLRAVIAPQMFRIVGMTLLAENVPAPGLDQNLATWIATGDAITSALAVTAFVALGRPGRLGVVLAAVTTIVGFLDIVHNLTRGVQLDAAQYLAAGWFVVAIAVPLMVVAHVGAIRLLTSGRASSPRAVASAGTPPP